MVVPNRSHSLQLTAGSFEVLHASSGKDEHLTAGRRIRNEKGKAQTKHIVMQLCFPANKVFQLQQDVPRPSQENLSQVSMTCDVSILFRRGMRSFKRLGGSGRRDTEC